MVGMWVSKLEDQCRKIKVKELYLIIDQAGLDFSIIPACNALSVEWRSLWQGLPEESVLNDAPLLVYIDLENIQQRQWIGDICSEHSNSNVLLALCSLWPIDLLANWLQKCIDARHEGRPGLLRFYDPRLFPLLTADLLNDEQKVQLHRPVMFWSWINRDGIPQLIAGNGSSPVRGENVVHIDLSDRQLESLMCVCDVNIMLSHQQIKIPDNLTNETLFNICYQGMCEATDKGIILDDDRERWVAAKLAALAAT